MIVTAAMEELLRLFHYVRPHMDSGRSTKGLLALVAVNSDPVFGLEVIMAAGCFIISFFHPVLR